MQSQQRKVCAVRRAILLLFVGFALSPANAQREGGGGQVSEGIFTGGDVSVSAMIPTKPLPATVVIPPDLKTVGVTIPLPILMMHSEGRVNEDLLSDVVEFDAVMDKLLPFCGCGNMVDWRVYNNAVSAAKKLRRSLSAAVAEEKKTFSPNASQPQIEAVLKRLNAVDEITTALEKATQLLTLLTKSLKNRH